MSIIVGEDRETGRLHVLGRAQEHNYGTKRKPRWIASTYIPQEIRSSPFWLNVRVMDRLPEELKHGRS